MATVDEKVKEAQQAAEAKTKEAQQALSDDKKLKEAQQTAEEASARLSKAVGKLTLAGIGAVSLGKESIENMLDRMVKRGEEVQAAARRRANALRKKTSDAIAPAAQKVGISLDTANMPSKLDIQSLQAQVSKLSSLDPADVPSKVDVESLQAQVSKLSARVDQLSDEKASRPK